MLAQNFKSADELGITEPQRDALCKTLVLLETGKVEHVPQREGLLYDDEAEEAFSGKFNMNSWATPYRECGTICCIGGTAELVGNVVFSSDTGSPLYRLFYPDIGSDADWNEITPAQAATALRSYLTTGNARWDLAVA